MSQAPLNQLPRSSRRLQPNGDITVVTSGGSNYVVSSADNVV